MTNHLIKYESNRTNDLRGVTLTKWDERTNRKNEKLHAPIPSYTDTKNVEKSL